MRKGAVVAAVMLFLIFGGRSYAGDWDLAGNVKRLERVSPDYKDDKDIDKKFLDILKLTEDTRKNAEIYGEAKRIAAMPVLGESKYMDSFLYYLFIRSVSMARSGMGEPDSWLTQLKTYDRSPHLLPALLIRIGLLPKHSPEIERDTEFAVEWIKSHDATQKVRAPEYAGNALLGYRPRSSFVGGDPLKLYTLSYYKESVVPLAGFRESETYAALLSRIKNGRPEILEEMAGLYRRKGKREDASKTLYELAMLKAGAKNYAEAKKILDSAVNLDSKNEQAKKERDRIKLELTLQSLEPPQPAVPDAAGIPQHLESFEGQLTPSDRVMTELELQGRGQAELRVMRNEIFARRGRAFESGDLSGYFARMPWYRQDPAYTDAALTDIDRENIRTIDEYAAKTR